MDSRERISLASSADEDSPSPFERNALKSWIKTVEPSPSSITRDLATSFNVTIPAKLAPRLFEVLIWYPNKNKDTPAGTNTKLYLDVLNRAISSDEPKVFYKLMSLAEKLHKEIGCDNSVKLWRKLKPTLAMCSRLDLHDIAHEIVVELYNFPFYVPALIYTVHRLRISDPSLKMLIRKKRDSLISVTSGV